MKWNSPSSSRHLVLALTTRGVVALAGIVIAANALWTCLVWHKYHSRAGQLKIQEALLVGQERRVSLAEAQADVTRREQAVAATTALAVSAQNEQLLRVRRLIGALGRLVGPAASVRCDLTALMTNDVGRAIAQSPDLVIAMHHLYHADGSSIASAEDIQQRVVAAKRLEMLLAEELGTPYEPQAGITSGVSEGTAWASAQAEGIDRVRLVLKTLGREAQIARQLNPGANRSLTLAQAMEDHAAGRALADLRSAISSGNQLARATEATAVAATGNFGVASSYQVAAVAPGPVPQAVQATPQVVYQLSQARGRAQQPNDPWHLGSRRQLVSVGPEGVVVNR